MTTYKVPYTFIPGTKAKASEVNANFSTVLNLIETTGKKSADTNLSNLSAEGKKVIYENSGSSHVIGEIVMSTIPIQDAALHLLDGALLTGGGIYDDFINYVASMRITHASLFLTEEDWNTTVETYGVCGKFVYDELANTLRLPKISGILEGTTDESLVGDIIEAGLPNINGGMVGLAYVQENPTSGAFQLKNWGGRLKGDSAGTWHSYTMDLDASRSSSLYGKSNTVQPQTTKVFYYIVVASMPKLDVVVDVDKVATDIAAKADVDMTNVIDKMSTVASSYVSNLSFPSNKYLNLTLGASGTTYTAPANGYVNFYGSATAAGQYVMLKTKKGKVEQMQIAPGVNNGCSVSIPIAKGDEFVVDYTLVSSQVLRFTYAVGSEREVE